MSGERERGLRPRLVGGPLTWVQAVAGYVVAMVCAVITPLVVVSLSGGAGGAAELWAVPGQYVLMLVLGVVVIRLWRGRSFVTTDLGLEFPPGISGWVLGAVGGAAFVVIGQVATRLDGALSEAGAQVAKQVGFGESPARDVAFSLSLAVFGPLGEELIYRGMIFRGLYDSLCRGPAAVRKVAFPVAALVSSGLFAVSHGGEGQSRQLAFLLLAGLIYAAVYWWTGSLVIAVFAHSVTNMINVVLLAQGASAFTTPLMWGLVAVTPVLAVAVMLLVRRVLGSRPTRLPAAG